MKKLVLLFALLLTITPIVHAQQINSHNMFWGKIVIADTLNTKLKWEVFLQKRTQNNASTDPNIFSSGQFNNYWLWLHYTLNSHIKVSVTPFSYFETSVLNKSEADVQIPPVKEFRWAARIEHETKGAFFNYANRYGLEYRLRDLKNNGNYLGNWRVRYMVRLEKPVFNILSKTKPVTFTLYDEVFIQFGKAVSGNPNVFDQNRISAAASYELVSNVKLGLGYIFGYQSRASGKEFDRFNAYTATLTFDNFISQFKKKHS